MDLMPPDTDTTADGDGAAAAPVSTRRPKSALDRELRLLRQIESRWRQLHDQGQLLVLETLATDYAERHGGG
jgi:hypothetical protein